jgi:uncharacterized protein (TIGR03437 family)
MVNRSLSLAVCVSLAAATAAFAQSSYIFQLPGQTGMTTQIVGLGDNDFARSVGPGNGPVGSTKVVATPGGSKFYILAPSGVFSANATLSAIAPVTAITGAAGAAEVTPDGKYLLVISDHFYIVNTTDDSLAAVADTGVPAGSTPISVSVSHDAKTAWVLANTSTGSAVTAVNLTSLEIMGSALNLPSGAASMALSARNFLYVPTSGDRIYEIDPVSMVVTTNGQIEVPNGSAGPLQFTPDGNTAYFLNRTSNCSTCPPIFKLNVLSHSVSGWLPSDGSTSPVIDKILVAGNNRVFGYTASSNKLWDISPTPLGLTPSVLGPLPTNNVVAVAVSDERPSARYLYVLVSDHSFYRVNLANNGIDGVSSLDPAKGTILSFAPIPAQSGATSLFQINPTQAVAAGGVAVLIGQFLDPAGRPVFGVPATFTADPAVTIATQSLTTTAGGWAQTAVTAPSVGGTYPVRLSGGSLSSSFQLVVGGGTPSGNSLMSIYAGDGQLLRQNESTLETQRPLTVLVTDSEGNPLENIPVAFSVTEGIGSVFPDAVITGTGGLASTNFTTAVLQSSNPFLLSKVKATSVYGSVEFYEETQDALVNDPHQPNSEIQTPANQKLTIPQGGFTAGAIAIRTLSGHTGQGIPNVGMRITDPVDETAPSTVLTCRGLTRADNNGVSRCDVQAFCQPTVNFPHVFVAHVRVGEYKSYGLEVTVTAGTASVLNIVSGNGQTGHPSDSFTLFARVTDGCGQPSGASGLVWSITQGSASFSSTQTESDTGDVSARITLGSTAGPVRVQLSGPGLSPISFNLTIQITASVLSLVSGGGQSVVVGQAFPNPVIFSVRDANNNPVTGTTVNFSVSGSASINPASATTNAQGLVQTSVTAGPDPGTIVVAATSSPFTASATLSSHLAGPDLTSNSFTNAASGSLGMTPCGLVTVRGSGIASAVQGVVPGVSFLGSLPTTLAGLSIRVQQAANNIPVPIHSVANDQSGQRATFQAPCELTPGSATVVVTVDGVSSDPVSVQVFALQPGIFTVPGSNGKLYGTVIRAVDGTYVTQSNPAQRGERCYIVVTGLGQAAPAVATNSAGTGAAQNTNVPMLIFLNGNAVGALSARYLFGSIGSYVVEFKIPADAPIGPDQSLLVVGLLNDGNDFVVGNTVLLPGVIAAP